MDGYNEKKWFVYMSDHHEGPFSLADIEEKMRGGLLSSSQYVWCDGMGDWKPMPEVPEFGQVLTAAASPVPTSVPPQAPAGGPAVGPQITLEEPLEEKLGEFKPGESPGEPASSPQGLSADASEKSRSGIEFTIPTNATEPLTPAMGLSEPMVQLQSGPEIPSMAQAVVTSSSGIMRPLSDVMEEPKPRRRRWPGFLLLLLLLGGGGYAWQMGYLDVVVKHPGFKATTEALQAGLRPHILKYSQKFPFLLQIVAPLPTLSDVSPTEMEELQAAARAKLEANSIKMALAVSKSNVMAPTFYIASNLPDGAVFDIFIEGVEDTLVNQQSFLGQVSAGLEMRLAKSKPLRAQDGKPIPRGEYRVTVMESANQTGAAGAFLANALPDPGKAPPMLPPSLPKGRKFIVAKGYFLGGAKDATYEAELKKYVDKMRQMAESELQELDQLTAALDQQLGDTLSNFGKLKRPRLTPKEKKAWAKFHETWTGFAKQMYNKFATQTPETLKSNFFYGMLYEQVLLARKGVDTLHAHHQQYFTAGPGTGKNFEIQQGEKTAQAQSALSSLKMRIEQAKKLIPPTGIPRKEGL